LNVILAGEPGNYQAHLLKGNAYALKGDAKEAQEAFQEAASISPENPAAFHQLATLDRMLRNYNDAMVNLNKVLQLKPDHLPAMGAKVSVYMAQKQPDKALSFLDQKIGEHEGNTKLAAVLYEMRGTVFFTQKVYDKSEADFKKALDLYPDLVAPYLSLARLYQANGETGKAISQYQAMLAKQPKFIQAYMAIGTIYEAEGKKPEAREMYEKALEVNPDFAPAANNLAWMLLQNNEDPDRAMALAKIAKEQLPDDPNVADTLGLAFIAKGLYQSAVSELSMAVEKLPEHPTVQYHLGLALWKSGEKEQAIEALKKALKTKGDFPERDEAKILLEEIRTERT
jgi:tetratricopeptide (TPR) repeat protein